MRLLIVNFHYVREVKPGVGIYPVTGIEFRAQIDELSKHFRFVSQDDLLRMRDADEFPDGNYCLLTFDDALAEQWTALDILDRQSIPAICFATTDSVLDRRAHDVHKLHVVFSRIDEHELHGLLNEQFHIEDAVMDDAILAEEYRYDSALMRRIKFFLNFVLDSAARGHAVDALFAAIEPDEAAFAERLYMSPDDLKRLARRGMLGTHSRSHRPLATLSADEMRDEITGSRELLEGCTGGSIRSISYPYGGPAAVSPQVVDAARASGMRLGFTMTRGMNEESDLRHGLQLNRVDTNDAPGGKLRSQRYLP